MAKKRIFISADHGLALIYFLQSDVVTTLLQSEVEIVLLTEDSARDALEERFHQPGLFFEGLRLDQCERYYRTVRPALQRWLYLLRWVGGSQRVNTTAIEGNYRLFVHGAKGRTRLTVGLIRALTLLMRRSRVLRQAVVNYQTRFTPYLYTDLFEKYRPDLVIASTPGWRFDRYLLREAAARRIPTAAVIVGWDNPSSYRLSGAPVQWITCWSEIQKEELVLGADWEPDRVHIGGIPSYDGYFRRSWLIPREQYFSLHNLDPQRKVLAYAASFVTFAPNFLNMATLAEMVSHDAFDEPCQLLIRLHPNHFRQGSIYAEEAERIRAFTREMPHVHIVEPVSLSGGLGHYSGEDMPEKASMMAYSDVFLTVYSTMVVETAIHDRPIISVCLDTPSGWNSPKVYSLPLSAIGEWPTHKRFRASGAGRVATNREELRQHINFYLQHPEADAEARRRFVQEECTFTDGSAGRRTGEYLLSLLERNS